MKKWLTKKVFPVFFPPRSLPDRIAEEMEQAAREEMHARVTVMEHEFLAHMARAKIAALNSWLNRKSKEK